MPLDPLDNDSQSFSRAPLTARDSRHADTMSPRISGFSSPTVSPTVASISTDKAIDFPRRANAGPALSGEAGVSFRRGLRGEDIDTVGMTVADAPGSWPITMMFGVRLLYRWCVDELALFDLKIWLLVVCDGAPIIRLSML